MTAMRFASAVWLVALPAAVGQVHPQEDQVAAQSRQFIGSASCRQCHERFYKLWAASHHGLAMQPFTAELAKTKLTKQKGEIEIGKRRYRTEFEGAKGWLHERGPAGNKRYRIEHALGGKNVYYFLTPMERGRLQVLPLAYDVRRKEWFDTTASAVRHFVDRRDEALDWNERPLTFNSACHGCHVSQISTNYDPKTDSYRTVWAEPGINCETCHGPSSEHVRVCRAAPKGQPPKDLEIIITKKFDEAQTNNLCAPCHARMIPLSASYRPGEPFFNHFDLVALEHPDFHPDGRDLGENYTYTLWRMNPCAKSGRLDCVHCHTPSGRFRFAGEQTDSACLPCHQEHVEKPAAHSHHPAESEGARCVACHMPQTEFARMRRSDHSMLPPTPAANIAFKSPNACNLCHADQDAAWADRLVREWYARDYQAPLLQRAGLIAAARKSDWTRLPAMLAYLTREDRDEVYAASLIRLLRQCPADQKWPVLIRMLKDASPLVRASAADALTGRLTPVSVAALLTATRDEFRVVRVRSAAALASLPREMLDDAARRDLERATAEFAAAMNSRLDDAGSRINLGNFYMDRREFERAIASFEAAARLQPDNIAPLVNASLAYNALGRNVEAEERLRRALRIKPADAAAGLNLGLLLGEQGRLDEAAAALRTVLKTDPKSAVAAYNLGVLLAENQLEEALHWLRRAAVLRPNEPKYAYTLAFFLQRSGDIEGALALLRPLVEQETAHAGAYTLLGGIYEQQGKNEAAAAVYGAASRNEKLSDRERYLFSIRMEQARKR